MSDIQQELEVVGYLEAAAGGLSLLGLAPQHRLLLCLEGLQPLHLRCRLQPLQSRAPPLELLCCWKEGKKEGADCATIQVLHSPKMCNRWVKECSSAAHAFTRPSRSSHTATL